MGWNDAIDGTIETFYSCAIRENDVANLSKPLSVLGSLIRKNMPFAWKDTHEEAFNEAKEMCGNYFATSLMDWSSKDALSVRSTWTDASQWGGGAGLFQGRNSWHCIRSHSLRLR